MGDPVLSDIDLTDIDLTDASVWEQRVPHDWLDLLRTESPVHWHEEADGPGFWALTRHEDVHRVSTHRESSRATSGDRCVWTPTRTVWTSCGW